MGAFRLEVADMLPPLPTDIETCWEELRRLQWQLIRTNERMLTKVETIELNKRSARGEIRKLRAEIDGLRIIVKTLSKQSTVTSKRSKS